MRILIISITDSGILNLRRELILRLIERGHEVVVATPQSDAHKKLEELGCKFIPMQINAHGLNPVKELLLIGKYKKLISSIKPDIVLTYTIKPNIYGGMACASLKIPYIVNITGLGSALENGGVIQKLTLILYKYGLRKAQKIFFQNSENQEFLIKHNVVAGAYELLPGSGVNLERHCFEKYPENDGTLTFLFIGRLVKNKGIEELIQVSKIIHDKYKNVEFIAIGGCEEKYEKQLDKMKVGCPMQFYGNQSDVHSYIKAAHAVVLPTYHEGMANVLLEAAACGRPILASNIAGCRETFDEGVSGFGFEPKDVNSQIDAIERFIALPYDVKASMGQAGRIKMERFFDRYIVVDQYIKEIEKR